MKPPKKEDAPFNLRAWLLMLRTTRMAYIDNEARCKDADPQVRSACEDAARQLMFEVLATIALHVPPYPVEWEGKHDHFLSAVAAAKIYTGIGGGDGLPRAKNGGADHG